MTRHGDELDTWLTRPARQGVGTALALLAASEPWDAEQALSAVLSALREGDGAWIEPSRGEATDGGPVVAPIVVVLVGVQDLANAADVARRLVDALPWADARAGVTLIAAGEGSASARRRAEGALLLALEPGPPVATSPPLAPGR